MTPTQVSEAIKDETRGAASAQQNTMKAVMRYRYGPSAVLQVEEVGKPEVGDNEALVRVRAAAVNPADWHVMTGLPYVARAAFGLRAPKEHRLGRDVAGTVEAVGKNVTRFRPGDDLYGEVDAGSFAEYVCVAEDSAAPKPANLTFEQAAAVPLAGITALQGLRDAGALRTGQRVLINGASGGVGTFAVQIGRWLGAEVTGVCSTRNLDLVRSLGAAHAIDYSREDFAQGPQRYDVIFDLAGNRSLSDLRRALTPEGTLVLSSGSGGRWLGPVGQIATAVVLSPFVRQRLRTLVARRNYKDLAVLTELVESGRVKPVVDRTYPLSETAEAIRHVEAGHARGKVVVCV